MQKYFDHNNVLNLAVLLEIKFKSFMTLQQGICVKISLMLVTTVDSKLYKNSLSEGKHCLVIKIYHLVDIALAKSPNTSPSLKLKGCS